MNTPARWFLALVFLTLLGIVTVLLLRQGVYGWTLFILVPFVVGGLAAWLLGARSNWEAAGIGALVVSIVTCSLLLFTLEGIGCVAMALPLAVPLGALGGVLAFQVVQVSADRRRTLPLLLLLPPAALTWDTQAPKPTFAVRTQIVVAASPEQVWKHVVTFSDLPEPREWYFHTGLAYPKRAHIVGSGPGAVRYCEFSTGPFVEPIEVWDEPRLLAFRVTQNPAPLHEWNPFGEIEPKHLHGYLVSKHGQFRLSVLAGGRTLLEGTTWYQHGLWPAAYWRWWSDAIIHRIHLRVLQHVQRLAEQDASSIMVDSERLSEADVQLMKVSVIIPAAGLGTRMGRSAPEKEGISRKQFMLLNGSPILVHTIRKFVSSPLINEIVVALRGDDLAWADEVFRNQHFGTIVRTVEGGESRQQSVENALATLADDTELVAVHDAVRPFIEREAIEKVIQEAAQTGAAIVGIVPVDTVKQVHRNKVRATLPRERLILTQTPQVFRLELLRRAFEKAREDLFIGTDESSLVERLEQVEVSVVLGTDRNIKITKPSDMELARLYLSLESAAFGLPRE